MAQVTSLQQIQVALDVKVLENKLARLKVALASGNIEGMEEAAHHLYQKADTILQELRSIRETRNYRGMTDKLFKEDE